MKSRKFQIYRHIYIYTWSLFLATMLLKSSVNSLIWFFSNNFQQVLVLKSYDYFSKQLLTINSELILEDTYMNKLADSPLDLRKVFFNKIQIILQWKTLDANFLHAKRFLNNSYEAFFVEPD